MSNNEQAFFYEICNLWNNDGNVSKNLQCFVIFSFTKGETYFKTPNVSMKIKSKSDFDTTEVKTFVSYDTIPALINMFKEHLDNEGVSSQASGHTFTVMIDYIDSTRSRLKFTDSNNISNDIVISRNSLRDIARSLRLTYDNIITLSLNFIKLSQNNEILEKLDTLIDIARKNSNTYSSKDVTDYPRYQSNFDNMDDVDNVTEEISMPSVLTSKTVKPIEEITIKSDDDTPPFDVDDFSVNTSTAIQQSGTENVNNSSLQDLLNTTITNKMNESNEDTLKNKMLNLMKDAYNHKFSIYELLNKCLEEFSILSMSEVNNVLLNSIENFTVFFNSTYTSFMLYFKKLCFITEHYRSIPKETKIPMFIFRVKFPKMYEEKTKLLNTVLLNMYEEYRSICSGEHTEEDDFITACIKILFGPFWTSYINVANLDTNSQLLQTLKLNSSRFLTNWETTYMKNLDDFMYRNTLTFDIKSSSNIERFFSCYCPTLDHCLKEGYTLEDVSGLNNILKQLKLEYSYEDIEWPCKLHDNLSNNFVTCLMVFSKKNNINEKTTDEELYKLLTEISSTTVNSNNVEILKAVESIDMNNEILKVETKA